MDHHLDLVSHWRLAAPVDRVWAALADPDSWPRWWPGVRSVRVLRAARADGQGSVRLFRWATRLPYELKIEVESIESVRNERIRGRSRGQLCGEGIWLLQARNGADGSSTDVTYVWRLSLGTRWMRWTAPLLAPLLFPNLVLLAGIGLWVLRLQLPQPLDETTQGARMTSVTGAAEVSSSHCDPPVVS